MSRKKNLADRRILFCFVVLVLASCRAAPQLALQTPAVTIAFEPEPEATPTPFEPEPPELTSTWTASPVPTETPTETPTVEPSPTLPPTATEEPTITLLFTGVIVPARCVQAAADAKGEADYMFAEVKDIISGVDLAIGTLNATISDDLPHTGCVVTYVLVGDSRNAAAMQNAGFDLMSAATNHIKNTTLPGTNDKAFFDTLDNLRKYGMTPIGAGENHAEAMQPVVAEIEGVRFGFVSLGMIEQNAFAGEETPGIAVLNEENLRSAIAAAREVSDVVIAMPHWGPEDVPDPTYVQRELGRIAVEAGADLVVGNHTHVVQAIQEIDGVPVFYGLGNFVFDQNWALDHQQGVILIVTFKGTRLEGYELIPTHVDFDGTVHIAGEDEAAEILKRIEDASARLP